MKFEHTSLKYVKEAVYLAQIEYSAECKKCEGLEEKDYYNEFINRISQLFEGKYGLVAIEDNRLVGYLSFWGGFEGQFGNVRGSFSPLFGSAFGGSNRGKIASLLFEQVSKQMVQDKICSFAICKYAHDEEIAKSLVLNGFGIRCSDAIRRLTKPITIISDGEITYSEVSYNEIEALLNLRNKLTRHMNQSPIYFPLPEVTMEQLEKCFKDRESRFFIAKHGDKIIGYMEIIDDGETFISETTDVQHICGAFFDEDYRGRGIAAGLLGYVIKVLHKEEVKYLGVDCETLNPTALRFWQKYFDNYTYSFVRRIDERILGWR